jgi:hypothetical protein
VDRQLLARFACTAYARFLVFSARTVPIVKVRIGSMHEVAALQPAARGANGEAGVFREASEVEMTA